MNRASLIAASAAAAALAASTALPTSAAPRTLQGTVGPGFTIHLTQGGKKVSRLRAGTYTLVVTDKSPIHNFRLSGAGLNKRATTVAFVGRKTLKVTLKKGTYAYVCDPHRSLMHGSFKVT